MLFVKTFIKHVRSVGDSITADVAFEGSNNTLPITYFYSGKKLNFELLLPPCIHTYMRIYIHDTSIFQSIMLYAVLVGRKDSPEDKEEAKIPLDKHNVSFLLPPCHCTK